MSHAIRDGVPGDFIETGVWRGGATVFIVVSRPSASPTAWSWSPIPSRACPGPTPRASRRTPGDQHHTFGDLAVSLEPVQEHFRIYDLLDDQVSFLKGWFKDTLPVAPIDRLAVPRLDGDMYESTMDAIQALGHKVSPGGFIIVDDFGAVEGCRNAIADYRRQRDINAPIHDIDGIGAYWRVPG